MYMLCVYRKGGSYGNSEGPLYLRHGQSGRTSGQIIIPKEARDVFDIRAGDMLIVLGDEKWGIAVTKADVLKEHAEEVFRKIGEEKHSDDGK